MKPFRDERGFTTTSMVLSMLVTLALVFTAAQVYRVGSASAEVQDVADAAALAAQGQVAEFMIVARFCDAIVLSLTLTGAVATGLGIAALCTPATAGLSARLIEAGKDLLKARNDFADRSAAALNKLQEALPFFAAACGAEVARANNGDSSGADYLGVALLVPSCGESIEVGSSEQMEGVLDEVEGEADDIREKARRAEEAAEEANRSKERAFARDCGDNPEYCMYERASRLAGLSGRDNPLYASVDTWSFSVALNRAKAYYRARLYGESPASWSIEEQARSSLREKFYRYAVRELDEGYVHETADSFDAYIPHLPSNTDEMRATDLYTAAVYPVTTSSSDGEQVQVMHAWMGCPEVQEHGVDTFESIAYMERADLPTCPVCSFTASSMGKVAAASTSIPNGFEYHYEAVADEAFLYEEARHEAEGPSREVKDQAGGLFEKLVDALKDSVGKRIHPSPPGKYGAVAFVVNAGTTSAAGGFASGFSRGGGSLGPRAAVSAATLVDEGSDEGRTVINSALDGVRANGGAAVGAAGMVLDAWSFMLSAYANGQEALESGIEEGLNALPLVGASGLGTWAAEKLESAIEGLGLQPAEVGALKPVLVNSGHVAARAEGSLSSGFLSVKSFVAGHLPGSTDLFSGVLGEAESMVVDGIEGLGDSVEIASIELLGTGGVSIPIVIPLPQAARATAVSAVRDLIGRIRSTYVEFTGVRVWE